MNVMRNCLQIHLLVICLFAGGCARDGEDGRRLVWADEFDREGLPDKRRWSYEEGFVRNRELQFFTRDRMKNARVEGGCLVIEARKENFRKPGEPPAKYTSASLTTQGKGDWKQGRFEVRAKLPAGRGMWPAIWLLGSNVNKAGWPLCGEIDIMENVGFAPDIIHGTVHTQAYNHTKKTHKGNSTRVPGASDSFHVYAIEWSGDRIDFFVDERRYFTFLNEGTGREAWPFDKKQFLILSVSVGGFWGGQKGVDDTIFPQRMVVDYVRVYQKRAERIPPVIGTFAW